MAEDCRDIFFNRPDNKTWVMARLHCSLRHLIQDSPLWEPEDIPDLPLDEEQMLAFVEGYVPDYNCRYVPYLLGGWFYITRSGYWVKKFHYKRRKDGLYHLCDTYTTEKEKGRNVLLQVLTEGFSDEFRDERLSRVCSEVSKIKGY